MTHPMGQEAFKAIPCNCADEEPSKEEGGSRIVNEAAEAEVQKPTQAEIIGMKKQFKQRMTNLMSVAQDSPFLRVSAEKALDHYSKIAERNPERKIDKASFEAAMKLLATEAQIQVDKGFIDKVFSALDCDENGALTKAEWASGIPLFFGGSGVEIDRAVFKQIDADGSGTLDLTELKEYCAPIISMMVPFWRNDLRYTMQTKLASIVFKAIDTDQNGRLTPEEFIAWCNSNNLGQTAIQCLDSM